jgi:colanic acid biosynthesis glycosyl transferase WcaI
VRILIVTQYFWPENFRVNDLAVGLHELGHEVVVLTAKPNYPDGQFFSGYGFWTHSQDTYKGILIKRIPIIPRGRGSLCNLVINYLSFAFLASIMAPFVCRGRFDVIIAHQLSPVFSAIPAILLRTLKRVPLIMHILDLWPESLEATGVVRSKLAMKFVSSSVRFIYRHCDKILVQSRGFIDSVISHGVSPDNVHYLPSSAEPLFTNSDIPFTSNPPALPKGFRILFAGNIGDAQDFETILAAAERTSDDPGIYWIIVGDGRRAAWVRKEIVSRHLSNVLMLGRHNLSAMPYFYREADVLLVTLRRNKLFSITVPGKLQSYLAFGKPILAGLDGEGGRLVRESEAGIVCPPGDAPALACAAKTLATLSEGERGQLGINAMPC